MDHIQILHKYQSIKMCLPTWGGQELIAGDKIVPFTQRRNKKGTAKALSQKCPVHFVCHVFYWAMTTINYLSDMLLPMIILDIMKL